VFRYKIPVFAEEFYTGISYSKNQFVIGNKRDTEGLGPLGINGDTTVGEIKFEYSFVRSRSRNWKGSFSWADKDSELVSDEFGALDLSDHVQAYALELNYDSLAEKHHLLNEVNARLSYGEVLDGASEGQELEFTKFNAGYSLLTFFKIPWTNSQTRVVFKSAAQYSQEALRPVEQFPLTGANYVRAYTVNEFSADSGIYAGFDWIFLIPRKIDFNITDKLTFGQLAQPFLFVDYGYGELNQINLEGDQTAELSGYGVGIQFNYKGIFASNLQLAIPLSADYSDESTPEPKDDSLFVFDMQYIF
jgi:hemolysin activation/secretion protein